MNNVYVIGFDDYLDILDKSNIIRNEESDNYKYLKDFPSIKHINSFKDAKDKCGFALIVNGDLIDDYIKFDINNRKYFNNIDRLYIYSEMNSNLYKQFHNECYNKYNKYYFIGYLGSFEISEFLDEKFVKYNKEIKKDNHYHKSKLKVLNDINNYIKDKEYISSKEISDKFNISLRQVQRYMIDINNIYNNIGYDYSINKYYKCK